ncbi:ABC transporter ATP-binding protein [Alkalicoccus urumqiensis]|uniref:ABC transporter ATP-binding protein n=1 Tax=Alkalicoccus urumqiensis TaxID=1548213 RepID=UPI001AECF01B|nr:ABC transporter ATP-binding protein [Alkalicoccus urumqiensis]
MLKLEKVSGGYTKSETIIHDVTFSVEPGEWVGLLGPNGAGKSTIMNVLLGQLAYIEGEVVLPAPEKLAFIPEHPLFFDDLTLHEHIEFLKAVTGLEGTAVDVETDRLLSLFRLSEKRHHYPASFSKGMQQKLMILLALLMRPDLYIIDEPFIGLDPKAMKDLLRELETRRQEGAGILMSTHVLDTAEKICGRFLLLNEGRLIAEGPLVDIQKKSGLDGSLLDCFEQLMEHGR